VKICASGRSKRTLGFDYITETVPKVTNTTNMIDQKPAYMKVIPSFNNESLNFWVYVGFSAIEHSAVFKFNSLDISGPPMEEEEESSEELIQDVLRDSGEEDIALEVNEIDDKPQRDTPSPRDGHM
jgi:hypothetical protein